MTAAIFRGGLHEESHGAAKPAPAARAVFLRNWRRETGVRADVIGKLLDAKRPAVNADLRWRTGNIHSRWKRSLFRRREWLKMEPLCQ